MKIQILKKANTRVKSGGSVPLSDRSAARGNQEVEAATTA